VQPPCIGPVRTYTAVVENGDVFVEADVEVKS